MLARPQTGLSPERTLLALLARRIYGQRRHLGEPGNSIFLPAFRANIIADAGDTRVPAEARLCLQMLAAQLAVVKEQILENDRRLRANARETDLGRRLMKVPGVGLLLASAAPCPRHSEPKTASKPPPRKMKPMTCKNRNN